MTMDRLYHDLSHAEGINSFRCDKGYHDPIYTRPKLLAGFVLGLCFVGLPLVTFAGDEPQELPKPSHMTVAPLFQEWHFDEAQLTQTPEGFTQGTGGQGGEAVG